MTTALTTTQKERLEVLVETINTGMQSFIEVGHALSEITTSKLWQESADSFEEFCRQRWEFTSKRAIQLMNAGRVSDVLEDRDVTERPRNERQTRVLTQIDSDDMVVEVWEYAVETAPEAGDGSLKMTAAHVEKCRAEMLGEDDDDDEGDGDDGEGEEDGPFDELGRTVEENLLEAHTASLLIRRASKEMREVQGLVRALTQGGGSGTEYLDGEDFERLATEARLVVDHAAFHTCCPRCKGAVGRDDCELCEGAGFITSATYDRLQEEEQAWLTT
jgi:hypothetical protein